MVHTTEASKFVFDLHQAVVRRRARVLYVSPQPIRHLLFLHDAFRMLIGLIGRCITKGCPSQGVSAPGKIYLLIISDPLLLMLYQTRISTIAGKQGVMRALLYQLAIIQHQYLIRIAYGR